MFTAVLDGLKILAHYDLGDRCGALVAVSPLSRTGQAVIPIREVSNAVRSLATK